jgi:hypothetical protein
LQAVYSHLTKNPLASCIAPVDLQGSGKLRFTQALRGEEGGAFASTSVPTWDPTIAVNIPGTAVAGGYTATITQSVS